ncbi:MAG: NADH-quinone oxidoreductase subunit J [Deltaproteobacteria bacterium]|nr:NADH-quinone oxidoreductase subunit J [Deltaproteobacteria bacterium]
MTILFYILSALAVLSAVAVISFRQPVYSALSLVVTLFSLAGLYLTLHAEFLAIIQILTYAGAILILFIFIIMLLNLNKDELKEQTPALWRRIVLALLGGFLFAGLWWGVKKLSGDSAKLTEGFGSIASSGKLLFTEYVLAFEISGILLTVALIGALVLAKRRLNYLPEEKN